MMKKKINLAITILLSTFAVVGCTSVNNAASPPPPPPAPAAFFAMQNMGGPTSVAQARQEFRNYRMAMGYVDASGRDVDTKSGYFDISLETLELLIKEASNKGWNNVRIYNGFDNSGSRTLLVNGLRVNGGRIDEASRADSENIVKIENPSVAGGSDCPRWCDINGTVVGK